MNIERELATWQSIKAQILADHPDMVDDDEALFDTLDGATNLTEAAAALFESAHHDEALAAVAKTRIAELRERAGRFEARADKKRAILAGVMEQAGVKKIEAASVTLSLRPVAPSVVITDEAALPDWAVKVKETRTPDKTAIKAILADGLECPGAMLSNGGVTIQARVK